MGLEPGRYLGHDPERVLVVEVDGEPRPPRRRLGRAKPRDAEPSGPPAAVPLTTLTAVRPDDLGDEVAARRWLGSVRDDPEALAVEISGALRLINAAVHAHRTATLDPRIADVGAEAALAVRVGYGDGDDLAEGEFTAAVEVPLSERRRRSEVLRPQERVAEVLGGRAAVAACELLLIRARSDLDAGRLREAALQLRIGLEALLAERGELEAPEQEADFEALEGRRGSTREAADASLAGALGDDEVTELTETLRLCERVLRRKRALG